MLAGGLAAAVTMAGGADAMASSTKSVTADRGGVSDSEAAERHDDVFKRGSELITPHMRLVGRTPKRTAGASKDLRDGIRLLDEALRLYPNNWSALWIQGKAFQALDDHAQAYARFKRSYALEPDNADIGRELMLECLEVGRMTEAVDVARAASDKTPGDAGLRANLALALLLAGRITDAGDTAGVALQMDPDDAITKSLVRIIDDVRRGKRRPPRRVSDLTSRP